MFSNASNFVQGVDKVFLIILAISFFFMIAITAVMIYFTIKYSRKKNIPAVQVKDNTMLEVAWTVIPLLLTILMFYFGYAAYLPMRKPPKDAMIIASTAKMWKWSFEYEGNKQSDTLYVPINKPIKLTLKSLDVIHGMFIPSFRIKQDVVPGRPNFVWFIPQELGEYNIMCSAYCGVLHSSMLAVIKVVPQKDFNSWVGALAVNTPTTLNPGLDILQKNGCVACHSLDGTKIVGPTFKALYGATIDVITDGTTHKVKADDQYLKSSITDPDKDIVVGYNKGLMKSYKSTLKEADITKIIDYLKTLKAK
jgi:cytochrome c oxidase subunit II